MARFEYGQRLTGIPVEDLVFLDEFGVNLSFIRKLARALPGHRADGEKPTCKGQNVSVIGAISLRGLLAQWSGLGAIDALTFDAFIAQKLVPQLWPGAVVIMDNGSIHKSTELEALITATGTRLIDLPPDSPDFSPYAFGGAKPYENGWSKLKHTLRRMGARTDPDLLKALEEAFEEVTIENLLGWFTRCCYCTLED